MNFFSIYEPLPDIKDEPLPDIKDEPLPEIKVEHVVSIKCDVCFKQYSTYSNLRKHRKTVHNVSFSKKKGITFYTCPNCEKTFKSKSNYNKHMTIYSNIKYTCNQCGNIYESKWSFARHTKMHDNPEITSCNKCNKILSTKDNLKHHMQSFHSEKNETKVQRVSQGNGMYSTIDNIPIEIASWPNNSDLKSSCNMQSNEKYTCNTCGSCYSSTSNLNKHIRKHHEDPLDHNQEVISKIKCDQCNRSYFLRGNLNKHMTIAHGMKRVCKHCNLEFARKRSLRIHILVVHYKQDESKIRKVYGDEHISEGSKQRKVHEVVNEINEVYDSIKEKVENNVVKSDEELLDQKITEDPITYDWDLMLLNFLVLMADAR